MALTDNNLNTGEKLLSLNPIIGTFIRLKAKKEAEKKERQRLADINLKEDKLQSTQLKNEYNQSQGLASMENLKNLRKKQLS